MGIGAEEPATLPAALDVSTPMLGRVAELDRLRALWSNAVCGRPASVVVRGPDGAGARRLVSALAVEVAAAGGRVRVLEAGAGVPLEPTGLPLLLVVQPEAAAPEQVAAHLTILLGRERSVPTGTETIDLPPLAPQELRQLVAAYFPAGELEQQQAVVRVGSGGWPGRAHAECVRLAQRTASQRISQAAVTADIAGAGLISARADLAEAVAAFHRAGQARSAVVPGARPWLGPAAYDVDDAPWFYGREAATADLVARLAVSRAVGLVGAAGSGMSSLLRAGMLSLLASDVLPGSGTWTRLVMRPGAHPMRELARQALGEHATGLDDLLCRLIHDEELTDEPTVLVVDQLEELWTTCTDADERASFLALLAELVGDPRSSVRIVLAVRGEYAARLADEPALAALISDNTLFVGAPTTVELRRVIEEPARRSGLLLAEGLADAVMTDAGSDAGSEAGPLPFVSSCLNQLWETRSGRTLTLVEYVAARRR